jgi:hypothetical protein
MSISENQTSGEMKGVLGVIIRRTEILGSKRFVEFP